MRRSLPLFLLLLCLGCRSATDPLEREFAYALGQVEKQELPSGRRIQALFQAFDVVQGTDYLRARRLDTVAGDHRWPELYTLYGNMYDRLSAVQPYFPLGARSNYRGGYPLDELATRTETARLAAGAYYLNRANAAARIAREGSREAARQAYYDLDHARFYLPERRDAWAALRDEMLDRGTVRIHLLLSGDPFLQALAASLPHYREPLREDWFEVSFQEEGPDTDLEAEVQLTAYSEWGPTESSSTRSYDKQVLDYVEKQEYEERVNDSTVVTKVREIEHFKTITATVTEVRQEFRLTAYGELSVFDLREGGRSRPLPLTGIAEWENTYSTCHGDRDALPSFACSGSSSFAPSTRDMQEDALRSLLDYAVSELQRRYAP